MSESQSHAHAAFEKGKEFLSHTLGSNKSEPEQSHTQSQAHEHKHAAEEHAKVSEGLMDDLYELTQFTAIC